MCHKTKVACTKGPSNTNVVVNGFSSQPKNKSMTSTTKGAADVLPLIKNIAHFLGVICTLSERY